MSRCNTMASAATIAAVFACALGTGAARAEDAACKTAADAGEKTMRTPNHHYMTQSGGPYGSQGRRSESVYTGDASYLLFDGKWRRSPLDLKAMLEQEQENRRNAKNEHCTYVRDEAVDGEAAGLFSTHYESDFAKVDALIWISKSTGLVLREELDMDAGGFGKTHTSMRIVYSGVQAPAGVN